MVKPLAIALGTIFGAVLVANVASAISLSIREAINGLPVADQINFIADEVDKIKKEQACQKAFEISGITDADTADNIGARKIQVETLIPERLPEFLPFYQQCVGN